MPTRAPAGSGSWPGFARRRFRSLAVCGAEPEANRLALIPGAVDLDSPFPSWPGDSPGHLLPHVVEGARYWLAQTTGMVRQHQRRLVLAVDTGALFSPEKQTRFNKT